MDSVTDPLATGRSFHALTILDSCPRECPAIEVDSCLSAPRVTHVGCMWTRVPGCTFGREPNEQQTVENPRPAQFLRGLFNVGCLAAADYGTRSARALLAITTF
jgi:hypothetical protein